MNDRVSAVPPADFLGPDAMDSDDYEKQFALDWKPPDLDLTSGPYANNNNNHPSRTSFVSVRSGGIGASSGSNLTRTGTAATTTGGSIWSKAPKQHGSSSTMASSVLTGGQGASANGNGNGGFLSRVGGRFGLTRSKSTFDVHDVEEEVDGRGEGQGSGNGNGGLGSFIPPVFKHKRSESVNSGAAAAFFKREGVENNAVPEMPSKKSSKGTPRPFSTSAAPAGTVAPPAAGGMGPVLAGFDPTRRPTRDEITANYQSLLASGFFGTHAIQSTRFAAPGQRQQQQAQPEQAERPSMDSRASFVRRVTEDEEDDDEVDMRDSTSDLHPPSPERQPPPPPPNRLAPPPPPTMAMDTDSSASTKPGGASAIPVSPTVLFNPTLSQQRPLSSESMPPPLTKLSTIQSKPTKKLNHKANLSFSAVPYSSTRPGIEPSMVDRPFRPSPVSVARFSLEGRRSYDTQQRPQQRGIKRPFFSAASNGSQASFATTNTGAANSLFSNGTPRPSGEYAAAPSVHRNSGQYYNGNAFTAGIAEDDKPESGARKLVKKLRKSASRISIDLGAKRQTSISRVAPPPVVVDDDDNIMMMGMDDDHHHHRQENNQQPKPAAINPNLPPSARTSMSSTVRRSFSWKFGKLGNKDKDSNNNAAPSFSSAAAGFVLNNNTDVNRATTAFAPHAPESLVLPQQAAPSTTAAATTAASTTAPTNLLSNFSFLSRGGDNDDKTAASGDRHEQQAPPSPSKKRDIRGRRLRKPGSPLKTSFDLPRPPSSPTKKSRSSTNDDMMSMDCDQDETPPASPKKLRKVNRSRSRSRSNVIRVHHNPHLPPQSFRSGGFGTGGGGGAQGTPATLTTSLTIPTVFFSASRPTATLSREPSQSSGDNNMEGVEFSFHFPGRMRPSSAISSSTVTKTTNTGVNNGPTTTVFGGPLAVVPDTNRGGSTTTTTPGSGGSFSSSMTTTTVKGITPHYSGRWVDEEENDDMIF